MKEQDLCYEEGRLFSSSNTKDLLVVIMMRSYLESIYFENPSLMFLKLTLTKETLKNTFLDI